MGRPLRLLSSGDFGERGTMGSHFLSLLQTCLRLHLSLCLLPDLTVPNLKPRVTPGTQSAFLQRSSFNLMRGLPTIYLR